ncbi:MAG: sugar phosphate isomerase/epimerase [Verrucomicrobiaceae bacterium]|nr:sugar phosphate isomerase/epimerase [Verrucomicrobiaceae bacterium]
MSDLSSSIASDRRAFLAASGVALGAMASGLPVNAASSPASGEGRSDTQPQRFRLGLNMSTIRGQELDAAAEIEIAGKAGYECIEPWFRKLNEYVAGGGSLDDLKKRIDDHGLTVESAIGFAKWIVNDPAERAAGLEEAKRDMDTIARLGGLRIAAPPVGVAKGETVSLDDAADRYRALLELGDEMGVVPQVEMWGGNPIIGTVEQALYVAIRSGHAKACFLGDVYHTYKGGSSFESILLMGPGALQTYHLNDYPADPPRATIRDADRVFPGDGIAPLTRILKNFQAVGAYPVLSLELFHPDYWKMPALECAKIGLEKMKAVVAAAT